MLVFVLPFTLPFYFYFAFLQNLYIIQVKSGASTVDTCEIFQSVTIIFNDIPMFSDICAKCDGKYIFIKNMITKCGQ